MIPLREIPVFRSASSFSAPNQPFRLFRCSAWLILHKQSTGLFIPKRSCFRASPLRGAVHWTVYSKTLDLHPSGSMSAPCLLTLRCATSHPSAGRKPAAPLKGSLKPPTAMLSHNPSKHIESGCTPLTETAASSYSSTLPTTVCAKSRLAHITRGTALRLPLRGAVRLRRTEGWCCTTIERTMPSETHHLR